jgi:hypothetical protein
LIEAKEQGGVQREHGNCILKVGRLSPFNVQICVSSKKEAASTFDPL